MRLSNKSIILTGAGAGIGEAAAIRLAEEGACLTLADLNGTAAERVAAFVRGKGAQAVAVAADISREEDASLISATAVRHFGGIDALVNNAADFTCKNIEDVTIADWQRVLGVNVIGTSLVTRYAVAHMKQRGGSIVNVASMSGIIAQPDMMTYNASKGAVVLMTRCMAMDLAKYKIRVNSVCPGCVYTTATEREWTRNGETKEQWTARQAPLHMLNRVGEAIEVANVILFLASDESTFMTGSEVMVDGGYTSR